MRPISLSLLILGVGIITLVGFRVVIMQLKDLQLVNYNNLSSIAASEKSEVDIVAMLSSSAISASQSAISQMQASIDIILGLLGFATVSLGYISWTIQQARESAIDAANDARIASRKFEKLSYTQSSLAERYRQVEALIQIQASAISVLGSNDNDEKQLHVYKILEYSDKSDEIISLSGVRSLGALVDSCDIHVLTLIDIRLSGILHNKDNNSKFSNTAKEILSRISTKISSQNINDVLG